MVDPDTSGSWRGALASGGNSDTYSTDQAGRIWVDKSVWATDDELAQAGMSDLALNDPENDFMVGISAIAYNNLKKELGMTTGHTRIFDVVQQVVYPETEIMDRFGVDVIEEGCTAVIPDKQEREQETFQYGDRSFHESRTHQEGLPDKSTKIK